MARGEKARSPRSGAGRSRAGGEAAAPRPRGGASANEAVRDRILASALALFARSGFEGTGISQIAREAGVASPLVYYYFADKDELWRAAAKFAIGDWGELANMTLKELRDADPVTRLKVLIRRLIYFSAQNREFSHMVMNEAGAGHERMIWLIDHHIRPLHETARSALEEAVAQGALKDVPPAFFLPFLIGGITRFVNSRQVVQALYDADPLDRTMVDAFADFVIDLLFDGLASRASPQADRRAGG